MKGFIPDIMVLDKKNLVGSKFNYVKVIKVVGFTPERNGKSRRPVYECLCDCVTTFIARGKDVKQGKIKSCGCYHKETGRALGKSNQLPNGEAAFNYVVRSYKKSAEVKELEFKLTDGQLRKLITSNCFYCGVEPLSDAGKRQKQLNSSFICHGVDRIDSSKGYTIDNCVPCCEQCNYAKLDYTQEEFYNWLDRIVEYRLKLRTENKLTNV